MASRSVHSTVCTVENLSAYCSMLYKICMEEED